jgi:hypothetical protein
VISHPSLLGIELKNAASDVSYSEDDPDVGRKNVGGQRVVRLKLDLRQFLARVMNSDAHSLEAGGRFCFPASAGVHLFHSKRSSSEPDCRSSG